MNMGRPPKPIESHQLQGTYRPGRHGDAAAMNAEGAPVQPDNLGDDGAALWNSIVPPLSTMGVVGTIDSAELSALCQWYQRYADCSRELLKHTPADEPFYRLMILAQMSWKTFDSIASQFGLTPAARSRLRIQTNQKPDSVKTYKRRNVS